MKKISRITCHLLQHAAFMAAATLALLTILSSFTCITVMGESFYYPLYDSVGDVSYEDSKLFQESLEKEVAHLVRYGVIRSQMETDGIFDPDKVIDVTAYRYRSSGIPEEYITANYRLGDLLRWGQDGIQYKTYEYMSGEEVDRFLSRTKTISNVNDVSGNSIYGEDMLREEIYEKSVVINRYRTVEGKTLENHVSTWEEYDEMCKNLEKTIQDLSENYLWYQKYQNYYDSYGDEANSNLIYVIRRVIGNDVEIYTNLQTKQTSLASLKETVKESCVRYVYYDPDSMDYETNTSLSENFFYDTIYSYGYAYPEEVQVILGVTENFDIDDCFTQGHDAYCNIVPCLPQYFLGTVVCVLLFLAMVILLTMKEGTDGALKAEDKLATEVMLFLLCVIVLALAGVIRMIVRESSVFKEILTQTSRTGIIAIFAIFALIFSLSFSLVYYSMVRRVKAKILWKNSMLRRLCKMVRKYSMELMEHSSLVVRTLLPLAMYTIAQVAAILVIRWMYQREWKIGGVVFAIVFFLIDLGVGKLLYRYAKERQEILHVIHKICNGDLNVKVMGEGFHGENRILAQAVNCIGESVRISVETSMKDERLKADLITNVSHDIKTPLTSIINYVDLIKREYIADPKIQEYIGILDVKSQRLKQLTDDLVEASKISSGNIVLHMEKINLVELLYQTTGEFSEKFEQKGLQLMIHTFAPSAYILADSRRIWRVIENLFQNIFKYALEGTRVYIDLSDVTEEKKEAQVILSIKNISATELNVSPDELTERFIRGDVSRTTEGSGLGLSIAKNLTEAMNGSFQIAIDGDLFKVTIQFPCMKETETIK